YPLGGTGMVYERMAQRVRELGGRVHLNESVRHVLHDRRKVIGLGLTDGTSEPCDHVISTMPLTLLVRGLGEAPVEVTQAAGALRFRNTILVYVNVAEANLFKDQWLYIHSPELAVGRITNFRNWIPELHGGSGKSILALEYWCYDEDAVWRES